MMSTTAPPTTESNNIQDKHTKAPSVHTTHYYQSQLTNLTNTTAHIGFGDNMTTKAEGTIRLYLQNINGAKLTNQPEAWKYATTFIKTNKIDFTGIVETRIEWNYNNKNIVSKHLKQQFSTSCLITSMCSPNPLNEGTPGGTASIITNNLVNRKTNAIIDPTGLGRWSGATFTTSRFNLHIITCYRPNQDNKVHSNTTYQQQIRILQQQGHDKPNPTKQILHDLIKQTTTWHQQGDKIIIMWDANDALSHSTMQDFQSKTNLLTLIPHTPPELSSYTRGTKVIDHILGSKELLTMVSKCGYLPFYEGAWISDHRPAFIDLQITINHKESAPQQNRNLMSNNHKIVSKYLDIIRPTLLDTNLTQKILLLEQNPKWNADDHAELESIDQHITSLLVTTEQQLKSPHNNPWSPELHKKYEIHRYWQIQKMRRNNKIRNTPTLIQLESKYGEQLNQGNAKRSIYGQFYISKKKLHQARTNARELRNEYLLSAYLNAQTMSDHKKMKILQNIAKTESKNQCYRAFHTINKPSSGGVNHIITEKNNKLTRIDNQDEIESTLQQHFAKHFNQATGTPFTIAPLKSIFGYSGVTDNTSQFLDNKLHIPNQTLEMTTFLQQLTRVRPEMNFEFPTESIIQGFKKWKEKTSTSPSGLHLGIYKSIIKGMTHPDTNLANTATTIIQILTKLIQLAIRECHTFNRWQTIHNFTIEKIPGYPIINKIRVIHIMEADWNLINKFFAGRQILHTAVHNKTTTHEQAGGRPGRRAIEEATQTTITYDICNLQHLTGGVTYNDAKSCYDRIPENLSNIAAMKQGLSHKIANLHAQTLQQAKYFVKLKTGVSTKYNQHSNTIQFHGVGQGAGDSPARWGYISDNIILAYNQSASNAIIAQPISHKTTNQRVQAFVDDCRNLNINAAHQLHAAQQALTRNAQLWEKFLHCASAKLELSKTLYFLFGWRFDTNGNHIIDNSYNQHPIRLVESETGQTFTLQNMQTSESYKLLGVHVPFTGPMRQQYEYLMKKCNSICTTLNQLSLTSANILLTIQTIAIPTLAYSLPATTIAEKYLNLISNKLANSVLPKLGYNRHFPRCIALAPIIYGGLQLPDLYHLQGSSQVRMLTRHLNQSSSLHTAFIQLFESYHIRTGRLGSCLINTRPCRYISAQWVTNFITYLQATQTTIQTTQVGTQEKLRQHDKSIMELIETLQITTEHIKIVNNVRTFLQITTLAEICNNGGTKIHQAYSDKQPPRTCSKHHGKSLLRWPHQPPPTPRMWRIWTKYVQQLCKPASWILQQPLGAWTTNHSQQRKWYGQIEGTMVITTTGRWKKHRETHVNNIYIRSDDPISAASTTPFIPSDISDTYLTEDKHIRTQQNPIQVLQPQINPTTSTTKQQTIILIGSHINSIGGAISWKIYKNNAPSQTHSSTIPNIHKPSAVAITTLGILKCIQHLNDSANPSHDIVIQTTKIIVHQLQKDQQYLLHYHKHLKKLCTQSNIIFKHNKKHSKQIQELNDIAKTYSHNHPPTPSFLTPTTKTIIKIRGHEVIDDLASQLLRSRHLTPVQEFLQNKYNWHPRTFNDIHWELHMDSLQQCAQHNQFNRKFIHHWLPVASHPSQAKEEKTCFRCNSSEEDQNHWLICPCSDAITTRNQLRTESVRFLHTTKLHYTIQNMIVDTLYNTQTTPPHYIQNEHDKQNSIGWNHFLRGRISKDWIEVQNTLTHRNDGFKEWKKAITHILTTIHQIWLDRNNQLHGNEASALDRRKMNIIKPALTRIYNLQHLVPSQDRVLFDKSIDEMLTLPTKTLEIWIKRHENYLQMAANRETTRIRLHNTSITSFFTKLTPTKQHNRRRQGTA